VGPSDEPGQPVASQVRASDTERNQTIEVLAAAAAEGRLSLEEYSERSEAALAARTVGDLSGMTADLPAHSPASAVGAAPAEITAVLGNESRKGPWVVPAHLTVRSVLGDCHLEMQQAVIRQHVTTIDATVRFGAMTIFVPDGLDVRLTGRAVLGAKSSELNGEPRPGAPVIVVHCNVFCGSINVRRPPVTFSWRAAARQLTGGRR
jgi:Domain of unknown function (DUF1707)/Cell wall-active antibiotics response 4TMS YvqF